MNEIFSENVFGTAHQYNHSHGNVCHGQTLVNLVITTDRILGDDFQAYLPKKYLQRAKGSLEGFETKVEIVNHQFQKWITKLRPQGLSPTKIWESADCWYTCERLTTLLRQSETIFLLKLRKDAHCHWFGQTARLDQVFNPSDN